MYRRRRLGAGSAVGLAAWQQAVLRWVRPLPQEQPQFTRTNLL